LYAPAVNRREAVRTLRRAYAAAPWRVRAHVVGRFISCPMLPVVERLTGGSLLDLGGGHGALAVLALAAGAVERAVVLEPDLRKPLAAAGLRRTEPRLRSVAGYVDSIDGTFDAVAILDVLYRLPNAAWDGLLAAVLARLAPGGTLLLKEIDPTARGKAAWNRLQERAVDLVGLTLGEAHSYEAPAGIGSGSSGWDSTASRWSISAAATRTRTCCTWRGVVRLVRRRCWLGGGARRIRRRLGAGARRLPVRRRCQANSTATVVAAAPRHARHPPATLPMPRCRRAVREGRDPRALRRRA